MTSLSDDQRRVVRGVEAPVEIERILRAELRDFGFVPDDVPAIGMAAVKRGIHVRLQQGGGAVLDPHPQLFQHHIALGQHFRVGQLEIRHAVRLHLHHERQAVLRDDLEIGGEIVMREGVVLSAIARDDARELAGRDLLRALEHQMFEEMRKAGLARRLVRRADFVPDHMRHDRRAVIGDHEHVHAVLKREGLGGGSCRQRIAAPEDEAESDEEGKRHERQDGRISETEQLFPPGNTRSLVLAGSGGRQGGAWRCPRAPRSRA